MYYRDSQRRDLETRHLAAPTASRIPWDPRWPLLLPAPTTDNQEMGVIRDSVILVYAFGAAVASALALSAVSQISHS